MTNWKWIIGGIAVALLLIALLVVLLPAKKQTSPAPATLPISGDKDITQEGMPEAHAITIPTGAGTAITTRDFLADPASIADPANPGYYYLGYHQSTGPADTSATAEPPYVIEYIASTHYFNISLYKEPIGQVRHDAEQYLLKALGVSASQLCSLRYMLSVPDRVNSAFSGENLGFSFCPGAVRLPD